jgi:lysophospholipase L1-like esterase
MKSIVGRSALALAGILAGLLLMEGLLQAASLLVGGSRGVDPATGHLRVLCLGDSNTYGISVERDEAWPARLQQMWISRGVEPAIEVINLGYPGTNSSQVLRDFERNLDLFDPGVVLVEVGANDFWTVPVPLDAARPSTLLDRFRESSRLYRLVFMATRTHEVTEARPREEGGPVVEIGEGDLSQAKGRMQYKGEVFDLGYTRAESVRPGIGEDLERNLTRLTRIADARDVELVFVTYASGELFYATAGMYMQKVAAQTRTPLIPLRPAFRKSGCTEEPCPEWIFPESTPGKHHPTAKGYELVAETVMRELESIVPGHVPAPAQR